VPLWLNSPLPPSSTSTIHIHHPSFTIHHSPSIIHHPHPHPPRFCENLRFSLRPSAGKPTIHVHQYPPTSINNFTQGLNLVENTSYRLKFRIKTELMIHPHSIQIMVGQGANSSDMTMLIEDVTTFSDGNGLLSY